MTSIPFLCLLGMVVLGILIMVRAVELKELSVALGKATAFIVLGSCALCLMRGLLAGLIAGLKSLAVWIAILGLVIALLLLASGMILKCTKKNTEQLEKGKGEL